MKSIPRFQRSRAEIEQAKQAAMNDWPAVVKAYREGDSLQRLEVRYRVPKDWLRAQLLDSGVGIRARIDRPRLPTPGQQAVLDAWPEVRASYVKGLSIKAIHRKYRCGEAWLRDRLLKDGVHVRGQAEAYALYNDPGRGGDGPC
ncbi:hypothetical protein GCM10020221_14860 [Streptomyces thioluteus]|uniref:Transposase n=1 Tax=Streptomyces thioluteus TaxID=66431 RepID=A0ABN3WKY8_STRTU